MKKTHRAAFTLVEVMVSAALVVAMMFVLIVVIDQSSSLWARSRARVDQFREARLAFDEMTTRLSQATLNTYWDYDRPDFPTRYQRRSELRFTTGHANTLIGDDGDRKRLGHCAFFNVPTGFSEVESKPAANAADRTSQGYRGLENLVNTWGYFIEYGDDLPYRPSFIRETMQPARWNFRLMQFMLPTEKLAVYNMTSGAPRVPAGFGIPYSNTYNAATWFSEPLTAAAEDAGDSGSIHVLAENIVALVILPRLPKREEERINPTGGDLSPLAPKYEYDSSPGLGTTDARYRNPELNPTNQLPPVVQVSMVAIDDASARRLELDRDSADIFKMSERFRDSANFSKDLRIDPTKTQIDTSLEAELIRLGVQYRIFTSNVPIRTAKWSRDQVESP